MFLYSPRQTEAVTVVLTKTQGTYTVLADVVTEEGDKVTCLTAKVTFHR